MAITVKKIVVYHDNTTYYVSQTFELSATTDYPYLSGKMMDLIPRDRVQNAYADVVQLSLFNGSGYGKMIVNVGSHGLFYLELRPEYWIEKLIVEPDDVIADIYHGERGLMYSFYNPTRRESIAVTAQIAEDVEGAFRDISAKPDDLNLRQYYIRRAMVKQDTSLIQRPERTFPEHMSVQDVAVYLNVEEKTIRNWTSEGKIPFVKLGTAVRYPKTKIDDAKNKNEIGKPKGRKKS